MVRPLSVYPVAIWVMIALFTQIRPLAIGRHFSVRDLSPDVRGVVLLILFFLIIVETAALLKMRPSAIYIAISTCVGWCLFMIVRVVIAIVYGPDLFSRHDSGLLIFIPPLFAILFNILSIRSLISYLALPVPQDATQALAKHLSKIPYEEQ